MKKYFIVIQIIIKENNNKDLLIYNERKHVIVDLPTLIYQLSINYIYIKK